MGGGRVGCGSRVATGVGPKCKIIMIPHWERMSFTIRPVLISVTQLTSNVPFGANLLSAPLFAPSTMFNPNFRIAAIVVWLELHSMNMSVYVYFSIVLNSMAHDS